MKYLELFESFIDLDKVNDLLIDFKQQGLNISTSLEPTLILDFDRASLKYIIGSYAKFYSINKKEPSLIINIDNQVSVFTINLDQLIEIYYYMLLPYISNIGLTLNYIYLSTNSVKLYFKSIDDIIDWDKNRKSKGSFDLYQLIFSFI